jgi:hypothetical protein
MNNPYSNLVRAPSFCCQQEITRESGSLVCATTTEIIRLRPPPQQQQAAPIKNETAQLFFADPLLCLFLPN